MAEFRSNKRKSEASERISEDDSRTTKKSSVQRPEKDENAENEENAEAEERRLGVSTSKAFPLFSSVTLVDPSSL
jgi:hypothetical protein